MPLVRLQVRNEFGLGQPELYRKTNREDPKAVLDGVAVAGLVGILRQLGDLADFAAEVFHGLQEQVMTTASRSHRLTFRVQNIEASLPALEKAVLAQTSHIHLAYTAGCEWHPRMKAAQNHFIYNDLPHFIMDSYEECCDPPRVHLLDKFDTGGPGSCFRRYSDPTFFQRVSTDSDKSYSGKTEKARESHKSKKKRSRRNGDILRGEQSHGTSGRMKSISSAINGRTSSSQTTSTIDMTMKSDLEHYSNSFDSKSGAGYIECVFHPSNSKQSDEPDYKAPSSTKLKRKNDTLSSVSHHIDDSISHDTLEKQVASSSSGVTWDEKEEIVESKSQACDIDKTPERLVENHDLDMHVNEAVTITSIDYNHILFNEESNLKPVSNRVQTDDIDSEPDNYVDALNTIESESENDIDYITKREVQQLSSRVTRGTIENGVTEAPPNLLDNNLSDVVSQTDYTVPLNEEKGNLADSVQENRVLDLVSKPNASNLGYVSPSDDLDRENMTRDTASLNKEPFRDLSDSLQDIPPLTSEPHASNLGPESPSDVPYSEEMTRDTVCFNKEMFGNLPDLLQEISPLTSEPHASNLGPGHPSDVPYGEEMTRDTVFFNKETFRYLPDSMQEIPPLTIEPRTSNLGPVNPSNAPYSQETTTDTISLNKEMFGNLPNSLQETPALTLEPHASNLASVSPSDISVSKGIAKNIADSHHPKTPACEQVPCTIENSVLDNSVCTDTYIGSSTVNDTVSAPIETDISFSGSNNSNLPDEEAGKINNNICKSEETRRESLADHSVRFWTNGGLLGLEPSKPPDFNKSTSLSQGSLSTKSETDGGSHHNSMQKSNGYKEERESSEDVAEQILKEPSSRFLTSGHNDDQACIFEKATGNSQQSNGFCQIERNSLGEIRVAAPESVLPSILDTKDITEPNQGNGENSSRVFGLSRRLLINSFQRKVSFDEKLERYNSLKSVILDQSGLNGIVGQSLPETTTSKEKVGSGYPIMSLPPSPPLEHMKISFHPVSGLEISKLKLKFPDGSNRHESLKDVFPSFQLVPEASLPLDGLVSHSDDDDTFCRSSPYISDDGRSPRSDYNSEQWESDETPENSDQGVHDSPRRRSSAESVSIDDTNVRSGHGTCTTNGVEHSLSRPLLDFPSYDNVNPALEKESKRHSKCNNVMSHSHAEPTQPPPPPPPLPPTQWRVSKPQLDMTNGTHHLSEDAEHIDDHGLPHSTIFQQPRLTQVEQIQINHDDHESYNNIIYRLKDKLDPQKLQGQKEANQLKMGKETDEREDFLYQIRTKAFNLRPTVTGKSNDTTGPTANVKVTAILEKANAIRQVVASDDGEDDDNWSDT
ncbi:protein SCAR1-like isoform X1 [Glycine soja]|uniref:Protein SCAR n=2 Tax=Glycine soja TaxID=3848 RepID=A0A445JDA8_GLYSO|nr:protein SCAR1-like isoform X1 [Glycine soja]RZB96425.1 Protein SCAR1 isoform A [Glycine soja]